MSANDSIDWKKTSFDGSRREQLRQAQAMTVRQRLEALDELTRLSERIQAVPRTTGQLRNEHQTFIAKTTKESIMANTLTLEDLNRAVVGRAAAFRSRATLQPAGGPGDKVFPPTYAGAVYATEKRRFPDRDEPVDCVLLDSVQSQANRMEEALQQAVDDGAIEAAGDRGGLLARTSLARKQCRGHAVA